MSRVQRSPEPQHLSPSWPFRQLDDSGRALATHVKIREALLLQKVVTDRLGNLSWSCLLDPEVIESWKFLRFRVRSIAASRSIARVTAALSLFPPYMSRMLPAISR